MVHLERPRLRPYLQPIQDQADPSQIFLVDRLGLANGPRRLTRREFDWLPLFDGQRTLRDIQAEAMRQAGGELLPLHLFATLAERLDEAALLDGPCFRRRLENPIREPSCIGCYPAEAAGVRRQLAELFQTPKGPGKPRAPNPDGRLRAALIPHIDYHRGGHAFAWGFKEVFEKTEASLFVIVGTSHYSSDLFTLTRKDFKTPLGTVRTDQHYIDRLVKHFGDDLFDDELAHLPEHSIELEVVFLQYLYEKIRPIRIVPLVVGSFHASVFTNRLPSAQEEIGRMIGAVRRVEEEIREPICYIISGDLAHIGPKFGDPNPVAEPLLSHSRAQDFALLKRAEAVDMPGYFQVLADEFDRRRICGFPPTFTLLEAIRPSGGKLLHYDCHVHPNGFESVSFASMAFYK